MSNYPPGPVLHKSLQPNWGLLLSLNILLEISSQLTVYIYIDPILANTTDNMRLNKTDKHSNRNMFRGTYIVGSISSLGTNKRVPKPSKLTIYSIHYATKVSDLCACMCMPFFFYLLPIMPFELLLFLVLLTFRNIHYSWYYHFLTCFSNLFQSLLNPPVCSVQFSALVYNFNLLRDVI